MTSHEEFMNWIRVFSENIQINGIEFPSIDLFFTPQGNLQDKAAAALAVLARITNRKSNQPAFHEIHLVVPDGAISRDYVQMKFMEVGLSFSNIHIWPINQLTGKSVLELFVKCGKESAFVILQGSLFVSDPEENAYIDLNSNFTLAEDLWAPQLYCLIKVIEQHNTYLECYVLIDSGEQYLARNEHIEQFMSLDSLAIITDEDTRKRSSVLAQLAEIWSHKLEFGRIGSALQSIESLPPEFDNDKPYLRIQLLHKAGLSGQALDNIETFDISNASLQVILNISRIAVESGGLAKSRDLLELAIPRLMSTSDFDSALSIARMFDSKSLQNRIGELYSSRYPINSPQKRRDIQSLISAGLFDEAINLVCKGKFSQDLLDALEFCQEHLALEGVPNYIQAVKALKSEDTWAQMVFVWLVNDAIRRSLLFHAFEMVFGNCRPPRIQTIGQHAFFVMRELILAVHSNGGFIVSDELIDLAFGELIQYVSQRPEQSGYRFEIENLLSHKIIGRIGLCLLIKKVIDSSNPKVIASIDQDLQAPDSNIVKDEICSIIKLLEQEGTVVPGRLTLPELSFPVSIADGIVIASNIVIEGIVNESIISESSINELLLWLSIVSIAVPHSTQKNADLELYRQSASRLAIAGHKQQARNLIDMVLLSAKSADLIRRREVWFVCADIYSRLGQNHQGLVSVACGLATDTEINLECAIREADVCTRLLRDIGGFSRFALNFHNRTGELLSQLNPHKLQLIKHDHVRLTIELSAILEESIDSTKIIEFINRICLNAREVLVHNAPILPMAMLLGQVILIAERENITVPIEAKEVRDLLASKLSGYESSLYQPIVNSEASATDLLKLLKSIEPARYASDAAFDSGPVATGARRLLAKSQINADETTFALELLSDRAMPLPGWQTTAKPVHKLATIGEPGSWAVQLSLRAIDVLIIGFDELGCLHAVLARHGQLLLPAAPVLKFTVDALLEWSQDFPYLYGVNEETMNLFYVSTEEFTFPFDIERATVIVASNRLQQLPPALYRVGDKFVGQVQPVFSAPSLGWLYAASSSPIVTNKRLTGWISNANQQGETLLFANDRLDETFKKHGIFIDTGNNLPDGFWGSELSVVVAHGSILSEGKYFQKVSDEGNLRVTTADFAKAFKNVGVVVLFVCSAGRTDMSPQGESTYGLARELLGQGCSAVIASPWPLDARVTYHWFPTFMDAWSSGKSLADATFLANQNVANQFNSSLNNCLAMTVFGDGLRLRMF